MPIDVLNHMWVGVFSASFVAQYEEKRARIGTAPIDDCQRFAEEAAAVADVALESYRLNCAEEGKSATPQAGRE